MRTESDVLVRSCGRYLIAVPNGEVPMSSREIVATERNGKPCLLRYAFAFRECCGDDYYSSQLLSHFLLHCGSGLKVAQSPASSVSVAPRLCISKGSRPRRRFKQRTTAWPAGPTASCCRAMPAPSPSSS